MKHNVLRKNRERERERITQKSNHGDGNTQADEYISDITQCSS